MRRTGAPPPPARSAPPQHHCRTANTEHITSSALTSAGLGSSNRRHTLQRCQAHSRHIIQVGRTRRLRLTMDHSTTVGSSSVSFDSSTVPDHGRFRRTRPGRSLRVTGVRKLYGDAPSIAPNVVSMERSVREAIKRHPYILLVTMLEVAVFHTLHHLIDQRHCAETFPTRAPHTDLDTCRRLNEESSATDEAGPWLTAHHIVCHRK